MRRCRQFFVADLERSEESILAERIPTGTSHINDQTLRDDAQVPFGGVRNSGNSSRFGTAAANIEAYTDARWITVQPRPPAYPF